MLSNHLLDNLLPPLVQGSSALGFSLSTTQQQHLLRYLSLLIKWNRAYNLSALREPRDMLYRHLLDSLSLYAFIEKAGSKLIDVGTGAGLPGLPLAVMFPQKHFTLLDSNGKKARFLFQVQLELGLNNIVVENRRAENFCPSSTFDGVLSRAYASLPKMLDDSAHLLQRNGKFWAMKGVYPEEELNRVDKPYKVEACHRLHVPHCCHERHLVVIGLADTQFRNALDKQSF